MIKQLKEVIAILIGIIVLCVVVIFLAKTFSWRTTEKSISPNKELEIVLMDNWLRNILPADRNFQLKVREKGLFSSYKTVFISPDEEEAGTERFIWSKDSTKFLLVAKNLIIVSDNKEAIKLNTGEYLYLFYDLSTNQKRCNCNSNLENPFTFNDISSIEFEENLQFSKTPSQ